MQFQSFFFLLFFFVTCIVYYAIPGRARRYWLLAVSWMFYLSLSPAYLPYLFGLILVAYLSGIILERCAMCSQTARKWLLAGLLTAVFSVLAAVKYGNFVVNNLNFILPKLPFAAVICMPKLLQPVGLSFFTFAAAGYLIDVYRGKRSAEKNIVSFAVFLSFFPTIMSGPIERSTNFLRQLDECHSFVLNTDRVRHGLLTMLYGYFLKTMLADRLSGFVAAVFDGYESLGGAVIFLGVLAFGIQLYCDFAGISSIAQGAGEVMGFSLIQNFETPYFSMSVAEFWRRWHISLSSWFRDYLYIPLGGNRKGRIRKYINLMVVFLVSGVWHGAGWNYIAWGGLNGAYQVAGDLLKPARQRLATLLHIDVNNTGNRFLRMAFTFLLINFSWLFFRASSFTVALQMLRHGVSNLQMWQLFDGTLLNLGLDFPDVLVLFVSLVAMILISVSQHKQQDWKKSLMEQGFAFRALVYIVFILAVLVFGIYGSAYSASSFIYVDF